MSYEQSDRLDRHSSDRNSNAGAAGIAREAYDPANSKWNSLNSQDTASGALPSLTLTNGCSGESAAMQNAASPGQNTSAQGEGSWMQNAGSPGPNSWAQREGSWMQNAGSAGENSAATLSGATGDAGAATPASAQAVDGQSGNQANLPAELQQLETGIQQQLQQLAQEVSQLQAALGVPNQSTGEVSPTPSPTAPASPEIQQPGTQPVESTPAASTPPQSTAPTTDATIQALQTTDPQAAQLLTAMEPATSGMTQAGFNQYESNFNQNIQGGQYPDVASAANAAAAQLQNSGDAADAGIATNVISSNINTGNDAALSTYSTAADPTIQALQASNPQAAQLLTQMQPSQSGMSAAGFAQFENTFNQNIQGGQYADVESAANAAAAQLQSGGDAADATTATNVINANVSANGDAALSTYTPPTPTPVVDNPNPNPTPNPTPTPTPTTDNPTPIPTTNTTGNYQVINGQIIGPNGQPFDAKGVAVYASQAQSEAATIMKQMPNLNFIRLASTPATDSPADIQADIQAFQSINPNVVVEVEDHTSGGTDGTTNNTLSGSALTTEENWYSQIAAANVNNPNVWFGTANEPNDPSNEQDVVNQEVGIYNAIRGTGNNNMLMLEADGGGSFGPQQADASAYAGMNNVAWDIHYYGWVTNGDTSVPDNVTAIQNEMAGASGITESNGNGGQQSIPFIIGEYGDSTDGQTIDANGAAAVDAVQTANNNGLVQGAVGWTWNGNNEPNNSDAMTQDGTMDTVTPYGNEIIDYVNTGATGSVT